MGAEGPQAPREGCVSVPTRGNRPQRASQGQGCPAEGRSSKSPSEPWKHKREAEGRAGLFPLVGTGAAAFIHVAIGPAP